LGDPILLNIKNHFLGSNKCCSKDNKNKRII